MTAISVIIPVYNVGTHVSACIESLKQQRFRDLEFIFIDDCSTDDTKTYIEEFANSDSRVRILRCTENCGSGPARNLGIDAAIGEYLSFVDPDDYIAPDFYELLYKKAVRAKADIAKGLCIYRKEDGSIVNRPVRLIDVIREQMKKGLPLYTSFTYEHWSAIYHRRLFADGEARYGTTRHEQDTLFLLRICSKTENIVLCEEAKYFFCSRSDSAMHRVSEDGWEDMALAFEALMDHIIRNKHDDLNSCIYVKNTLNYRFRCYYAMKDRSCLASGYRNHLEKIRSTVLSYPFLDEIKKTSFPIKVLVDYGICLPDDVYSLPWDQKRLSSYLDLTAAYFRFAMSHPQFTLKCDRQIYRLLRNLFRGIRNQSMIFDVSAILRNNQIRKKHD